VTRSVATDARMAKRVRIAMVGLGLLTGLFFAEFVLLLTHQPRLYEPPRKDSQLFVLREGELRHRLGWLNRPAAEIVFRYDGDPRGYLGPDASIVHRTNSQGFRGVEHRRDKKPGTVRIAFLGDSMTFGEGVREEDTFVEGVCARLAEAQADRSFDCQNWGVSAYNTMQSVALLHTWVLDYAPDVVVLGFVMNDAEISYMRFDGRGGRVAPQDEHSFVPLALDPARCFPRVVRLLCSFVKSRVDTERTLEYYRYLYREDSESWARNRQALVEFGRTCREHEIPCYAAVFPELWSLDDYPLLAEHRSVLGAVQSAGLRPIDLLPALAGHEGPDLWVHPTDRHGNEVLHAIVAERVAARLASDHVL